MAVPKRKTSPSKRGMRRSNHAIKKLNIVVDPTTGEAKLPHHLSLADGYYNGREVFTFSDDETEDNSTDAN